MDIERHDTYIALFLLRTLDGDMSWRGEEVKKKGVEEKKEERETGKKRKKEEWML